MAIAAVAAILGTLALAACSETSLNEAPIVDLSARAGAHARPPVAAPATASGEVFYTVQKGDTLFHLAANAHASTQDLARWNGIDERAPIFVGQRLRLQPPVATGDTAVAAGPGAPAVQATARDDAAAPTEAVATPIPLAGGGSVETRALETVPLGPAGASAPGGAIAADAAAITGSHPMASAGTGAALPALPSAGANPGSPAEAYGGGTLNAASSPSPASPEASTVAPVAGAAATGATAVGSESSAAANGWIWPVSGPVTGKFDPVRSKGIEIAAPEDAPIVAVADGTVSYTGSPRDYGNLVILKHGEDLLSVYAHVKTVVVKEGQAVQRGQVIATAGKSGSGPATVHFEARRNRAPVDPLELLPLR
jgi:lipoprotein NlpD